MHACVQWAYMLNWYYITTCRRAFTHGCFLICADIYFKGIKLTNAFSPLQMVHCLIMITHTLRTLYHNHTCFTAGHHWNGQLFFSAHCNNHCHWLKYQLKTTAARLKGVKCRLAALCINCSTSVLHRAPAAMAGLENRLTCQHCPVNNLSVIT